MSNNVEVQYLFTINTELTYAELRKLETVLMRITSYIERMTGSPELKKLLNYIQLVITAIRSLQMALHTLELASGPIGWAYAATSVAAAGLSGYAIYESITGV